MPFIPNLTLKIVMDIAALCASGRPMPKRPRGAPRRRHLSLERQAALSFVSRPTQIQMLTSLATALPVRRRGRRRGAPGRSVLQAQSEALPEGGAGAIGHLDGDTAISRGTFAAALAAAGSVCRAVDAVVAGQVSVAPVHPSTCAPLPGRLPGGRASPPPPVRRLSSRSPPRLQEICRYPSGPLLPAVDGCGSGSGGGADGGGSVGADVQHITICRLWLVCHIEWTCHVERVTGS